MNLVSCGTILMVIFLSCAKHQEEETVNPLDELIQKRDLWVEQMSDAVYLKRCDKLTFKALVDAFGWKQDIFNHEWADGMWHRDNVKPCYPDHSKSEVSRDCFLGLFHSLWTRYDRKALERIDKYGSAHNWIMGEGDIKLTSLAPLVPTLATLLQHTTSHGLRGEFSLAEVPIFEGSHREHLIALYVHLRGRIYGGINTAEKMALQALVAAHPENPYFLALKHRYHDGQQEKAIEILMRDYADDDLPMDDGAYGWGSCPRSVYFFLVVAVLEGQ